MPHVNTPSATGSSGRNKTRGYRRSLSKHRMKLSRYKLSGTTHSRGIGATFCVRWLVTASNKMDAQAAKPIHRSLSAGGGAGARMPSVFWTGSTPVLAFDAAHTHTTANTAKPQDHATA